MPMRWTPENDRILLLKLIETHGISVNPQLILNAWPKDAPTKPETARAISERFVRLRKDAGINASIQTPGKGKPRAPKFTTPKKRKTKNDSESDAEDHFTEGEETPTSKRKSTQRGGGPNSGRGQAMLGGRNDGSPCGIRIKRENPGNSVDPAEFNQLKSRASELRTFMDDPFDTGISNEDSGQGSFSDRLGVMNGNGYHQFPSTDDGLNPFSMSNGMGNGVGFNMPPSHGMTMGMSGYDPLATSGSHWYPSPQPGIAEPHNAMKLNGNHKGMPARGTYSSAVSSEASGGQDSRARSARKASQQASEGMNAWLQQQKVEDKANGEKTSDEDSQASEFHESDGDYI